MPEISFVQFLADMANPQLAFLPRALAAAVIAAVLCAVVGCFVVLRGMAFIGDAVAHAVVGRGGGRCDRGGVDRGDVAAAHD